MTSVFAFKSYLIHKFRILDKLSELEEHSEHNEQGTPLFCFIFMYTLVASE